MDDKFKKRVDSLFALEMKFSGESFFGTEDYNKDFNVHHSEITCDNDEVWEKKVQDLKVLLEKRKVEYDLGV